MYSELLWHTFCWQSFWFISNRKKLSISYLSQNYQLGYLLAEVNFYSYLEPSVLDPDSTIGMCSKRSQWNQCSMQLRFTASMHETYGSVITLKQRQTGLYMQHTFIPKMKNIRLQKASKLPHTNHPNNLRQLSSIQNNQCKNNLHIRPN